MQRGVLIISIALIIGAIAYLASQPSASAPAMVAPTAVTAVTTAQTPNGPTAPTAFGPTTAESGPASSASGPGEWLMEGSNPARTRATAESVTLPLSQRREIGIPGDTENSGSPPVIARGMLLVETTDHLRAFDLATGQQRWLYEEQGSYISPAVAGDRVFIRAETGTKGEIIALDLKTGQQLWTFTPRGLSSQNNTSFGGHLTSPVIVDDIVYVAGGSDVYALDAQNGQSIWTFRTQDLITSSATVNDGSIYISDFRYTYAIDLKQGTFRWATPIARAFSFAPIAASDIVLVSNGDKLVALDAASGQQRWEMSIPSQSLIPAAADETLAYVKSNETLYALDLSSGKERWRYRDANFVSLPVLSNDHVFVVSGLEANTKIAALDRSNGVSAWEQAVTKLATTAPIVAGQSIYVQTTDGRIVAFSS